MFWPERVTLTQPFWMLPRFTREETDNAGKHAGVAVMEAGRRAGSDITDWTDTHNVIQSVRRHVLVHCAFASSVQKPYWSYFLKGFFKSFKSLKNRKTGLRLKKIPELSFNCSTQQEQVC